MVWVQIRLTTNDMTLETELKDLESHWPTDSAAKLFTTKVPNEELKTNGQGLYSRLCCIWEIKASTCQSHRLASEPSAASLPVGVMT